jgi:serine/threonine protein kinase
MLVINKKYGGDSNTRFLVQKQLKGKVFVAVDTESENNAKVFIRFIFSFQQLKDVLMCALLKVVLKVKEKENRENSVHDLRVQKEIEILQLLRHPNIVQVLYVNRNMTSLLICTKYVAGEELYDYILLHSSMPERTSRTIFRQIISAVAYCHSSCVFHRDLKPENILIDKDLNISIMDFGLSKVSGNNETLDTICGSPAYVSPEIMLGLTYTGREADIWSLGVILYLLLTGKLPFRDSKTEPLLIKIISCDYVIPSRVTTGK